jgi:hypothetical protein
MISPGMPTGRSRMRVICTIATVSTAKEPSIADHARRRDALACLAVGLATIAVLIPLEPQLGGWFSGVYDAAFVALMWLAARGLRSREDRAAALGAPSAIAWDVSAETSSLTGVGGPAGDQDRFSPGVRTQGQAEQFTRSFGIVYIGESGDQPGVVPGTARRARPSRQASTAAAAHAAAKA